MHLGFYAVTQVRDYDIVLYNIILFMGKKYSLILVTKISVWIMQSFYHILFDNCPR